MLSREKKILVVDDSTTHRMAVSKILQSVANYHILEASDGSNALEMLKKEYIDLVLLDVMMPVMNGFETLTAIREDEELSDVPVIMCTSMNEREEVMRLAKQGIAGYIVKPPKKETLLPKVQQVLAAIEDASNQEKESNQTQQKTDVYLALIADEDETFRKIARMVLGPYYNIIEAVDESTSERLISDRQPQVILIGRLEGTLNYESFISRLNPLIQQKKTRIYRIYSTAIEAMAERSLKYHGRLIRTLDANIFRSRLYEMKVLPDFTVSRQKSAVVVGLKNYYPQNDEESHMLMRSIAMGLGADMRTVRFDLSDWGTESEDELVTAGRYLETIIAEFKSLGVKVEIVGYEFSEGSPLAALFADQLEELQQESIEYLTTRINRLQRYYKLGDADAITSLGNDLHEFGEERRLPQLSTLAGTLIKAAEGKRWEAIETLIQELLQERKSIEDSIDYA